MLANSFDLSALAVKAKNWVVYDNSTYHTAYEVTAPCSVASTAPCADAATIAQSSSYALIGPQGSGKSTCYALGGAPTAGGGLPSGSHATLLAPGPDGGAPGGISVTIPGGEGGRTLIYNVVCDHDAPVDEGPSSMDWTDARGLTCVFERAWIFTCIHACKTRVNFSDSKRCSFLRFPVDLV